MKIFNKILTIGTLALIGACEPIEDRDVLTNSYDPDNIELIATQTADGTGNGITLKMNTPGVNGYWDYKLNKGLTNEVSFISPFMGDVTFTYTVSTPYIPNGKLNQRETITKDITVSILVADQPVPQAYKYLVGEDLQTKTWVFDGSGGDGERWWYMSDPADPLGLWWNAGGECCPPTDATGKMVFDLAGAANYTYFADAAGAGVTGGSFAFSADFGKLTITGPADLLGVNGCGTHSNGRIYNIVELTADKLVLSVPNASCGSGWTWVFVPEP
jgi:hypothetical protein